MDREHNEYKKKEHDIKNISDPMVKERDKAKAMNEREKHEP